MTTTDRMKAAPPLADRPAGGLDRGSRAVRGPAATGEPVPGAPDPHGPGRADPGTRLAGGRGRPRLVVRPHRDRSGRASRRARGPADRRAAGRGRLEPLADPVQPARHRDPRRCPAPRWKSSGSPTAGSTSTRRSSRSSARNPRSGSSSRSPAAGLRFRDPVLAEPFLAEERGYPARRPAGSPARRMGPRLKSHAEAAGSRAGSRSRGASTGRGPAGRRSRCRCRGGRGPWGSAASWLAASWTQPSAPSGGRRDWVDLRRCEGRRAWSRPPRRRRMAPPRDGSGRSMPPGRSRARPEPGPLAGSS